MQLLHVINYLNGLNINFKSIESYDKKLSDTQIIDRCNFGLHVSDNDNREVIFLLYEKVVRDIIVIVRKHDYLDNNKSGKYYTVLLFKKNYIGGGNEKTITPLVNKDYII